MTQPVRRELKVAEADDVRGSVTRATRRTSVDLEGTLRRSDAVPIDMRIRDISAAGFSMTAQRAALAPGDTVRIGISGLGRHEAHIVWERGDEYGCVFRRAFDLPALDTIGTGSDVIAIADALPGEAQHLPPIEPEPLPWALPPSLLDERFRQWRGLIMVTVIALPWAWLAQLVSYLR